MDTFSAVADPTRRALLETLAAGSASFGELADRFEMSRPAVSQHLKVLRDVGLVSATADGQRRIYRLQADRLAEIERWVGSVRRFWHDRLAKLDDALAAETEHTETD